MTPNKEKCSEFIWFRFCLNVIYYVVLISVINGLAVVMCGCNMVNLSEFIPVAPGWVMMADMGMVLMMVVPCLVVEGDTPLMLRIVGLFPVPPAWEVVMMVVGLPSAEVTSFRMVPAGRGPFVWGETHTLCKPFGEIWCLSQED